MVALGSRRARGRRGVRALLSRLFQWRVSARWYVFAFSYMAAIKLTVAIVHRVVTGAWPGFGFGAWYVMIAATVFSTVVGGQAAKRSAGGAMRFPVSRHASGSGREHRARRDLGLLHLPLFFLRGADTYGQSFPPTCFR